MNHHSKGLIEENTMHYILKQECSQVMQIIAIIWLFLPFIHNISVKLFCKGPWLGYNNITYIPKSPKNCSDYKVSYKCSSNYYHFSSRVTFIFVNRVIFVVFFSL